MKRFLSFLICLAVVISSVSVAGFASDSDHWAFDTVKELVEAGIVSGDSEGKLNLDNYITRAEFVKTVNKYFGFTKMSNANFQDVSENSWYFNEMLIAKEQGYIKGDQNGNANPDARITRAEVSVIIARLLNLSDSTGCSFSDENEIPDWAKGAIGALSEKGIVNGYTDGSFKAGNSISRAEAFVIIKRNNPVLSENKKENPSEQGGTSSTPVVFVPSNGGSSSGGGGGGGGSTGGSVTVSAATLSTRAFNKDSNTVEFVAENAAGYNVKFVYAGGEYIGTVTLSNENGTYKYLNYTSLINDAVANVIAGGGANGFNADIYVQAVAIAGYQNSSYVKFGTDFLKFDIPEVTGILVSYNETTGDYNLSWTAVENITDYKVTLYSDSQLSTPYKEYIVSSAESFTVPAADLDSTGSVYYMTVTAKKDLYYGAVEKYSDVIVNGLGGGNGTSENPYIIKTAKQFKNVFAEGTTAPNTKETYYLLTGFDSEPMILNDYKPMKTAFTGKLIGGNINDGQIVEVKQIIEVTSSLTTDDNIDGYQGTLFHKLDGATIKNIKLTGTLSPSSDITGNSYFGGVAGYIYNGATIENVENHIDITTYQNTATGGIVASSGGDVNYIKNCHNYGDIKNGNASVANVGGIIGDSFKTQITECSNSGDVIGKSNIGGIVGVMKNNSKDLISGCANYGDVEALNGLAGGIAGEARQTIEKSFNAGEIKASTYAGCIVGVIPNSHTSNIKSCYNIGKITGGTASGLVVGNLIGTSSVTAFYDIGNPDVLSVAGANTGTLTVKSAYGYSTVENAPENDVKKVSSDYIANLTENDSENFPSDIWGTNDGYSFPGFNSNTIEKGNDYIAVKLAIADISYDRENGKWYITIEPSLVVTTGYKLFLDDSEMGLEKVSDTVYEIKDVIPGIYDIRLEAYNGEAVVDTAESENFEFVSNKLEILGVDFENGKWYVSVEPTGKGTTTDYKIIISNSSGSQEIIENTANSDNKYEIETTINGLVSITVEAYNGTDKLDTSSSVSKDLTFSGGLGTLENPYILTNAEQFKKAFALGSSEFAAKHFVLTGYDVDELVLTDYKPMQVIFSGSLKGGNIENGVLTPVKQKIRIETTLSDTDEIGQYSGAVFHHVKDAVISHLALYGTVNAPNNNWNIYVGVLAGDVNGSGESVHSVVTYVDNYVTLNGTENQGYGGIAGKIEGFSEMSYCNNFGDITATGAKARAVSTGGIAGEAHRAIVTNCNNYGTISGNINVGGVIGYANTYPVITDCKNEASVSSSRTDTASVATYVGEIVGKDTRP